MHALDAIFIKPNRKFFHFWIAISMSSNALRVVPVVDGIGEASSGIGNHCTSLCINKEFILLGRANGKIDCYRISSQKQPVTIPTVELTKSVEIGTRKAITDIVSVGAVIVAVSGDNMYYFPTSLDASPILLLKGVVAVTIQEQSNAESQQPPIAFSTAKRRVGVFKYSGSSYSQDANEISTGADVLTRLVWFNSWIVGASARSYVTLSPTGDRIVRDLFPVDTTPGICILKASNEVLLIGQDGLGIFMNVQSDGLSPAPRNTVSIHHADVALSVLGTYLLSIEPHEGLVDVHSLASNDPKLIQTINLPASAVASGTSFSTPSGLAVVAGAVLYLLITVPFESQFKKLIDAGKFEDALELINYQFLAGEARDKALKDFHRQVGWKLFNQLDFKVAFVHFNLCLSLDEVVQVLSYWGDSRLSDLIASNSGKTVSSDAALVGANEAVATFALAQRSVLDKTNDAHRSVLGAIDSLLLRVLGEGELVQFLKSHEMTLGNDEVLKAVANRSPVARAIVLEQAGQIKESVEALIDGLPVTESEILGIFNRNVGQLHDAAFVNGVVAQLVQHNASTDALVSLITRLSDPLTVLKSVTLSPEVSKCVLSVLSECNADALAALLDLSVKTGDAVAVEQLVVKHRLIDSPSLTKTEGNADFDFARMLVLGNRKEYRDAFRRFPNHGEEFIRILTDTSDVPNKSLRVQLVVLLASVLFENNEQDKAVNLLVANEQFLTGPGVKPALVIEILPSDLLLTDSLIGFLKRFNRHFRNVSRNAVIGENMNAYKFLSTHNEWSIFRQTKPTVVTDETVCGICAQSVTDKHNSIAVLPNGTLVHASCLDHNAVLAGGTQ